MKACEHYLGDTQELGESKEIRQPWNLSTCSFTQKNMAKEDQKCVCIFPDNVTHPNETFLRLQRVGEATQNGLFTEQYFCM